MGELLRYPRNSPVVVEGYATRGETGPRMNDARRRAELVQDYLAQVLRRPNAATAAMPLGADAADSPSGDGRWDGVALALFAETARLERAVAAQ